jgi:flagellar motility protein MotE (MotC chaperone)
MQFDQQERRRSKVLSRIRLLPVLIVVLAFTLSLKLGSLWDGANGIFLPSVAIAQESKPKAVDTKKNSDKKVITPKKTGGEQVGRFEPGLVTDSELEILQKLVDRRAKLKVQEQRLDTRERLLMATEKRINAKLEKLKLMQATISKLLTKHEKQKEKKMKSIVKIYEKMKPGDAARIFEELDMAILLDVVERMKEAKTAPIMAKMTPGKAKLLTAELTQRRALPTIDQNKKRAN